MILQASEHITTVLRVAPITSILSGGLWWELAEKDTQAPFATYTIGSEGKFSKDGINGFDVQIRVFAEGLNEASRIAQTIDNYIKDSEYNWRSRGARSGYNDQPQQDAFIEISYNFKL